MPTKPIKPSGDPSSVNRRQAVLQTMALAAAPTLPGALAWPGQRAAAAPPLRFYKVVYDTRFPQSVAFARAAENLGLPIHAIDGDVTSLLRDDLRLRWREAPAAIAGLTTPHATLCLEMFAWDAGLRTLFKGEHKPAEVNSSLRHVLVGPEPVLAAASLLDAGGLWSAALAQLFSAFPDAPAPKSKVALQANGGSGQSNQPLVSWVIGPRRSIDTRRA